jgi:transcription initiation factor TFIIH subunit 2
MSFQRLVRFTNAQGATNFGDLTTRPTGDLKGAEVEILEGDIETGFRSTGRTDKIQEVCGICYHGPVTIEEGLTLM